MMTAAARPNMRRRILLFACWIGVSGIARPAIAASSSMIPLISTTNGMPLSLDTVMLILGE